MFFAKTGSSGFVNNSLTVTVLQQSKGKLTGMLSRYTVHLNSISSPFKGLCIGCYNVLKTVIREERWIGGHIS